MAVKKQKPQPQKQGGIEVTMWFCLSMIGALPVTPPQPAILNAILDIPVTANVRAQIKRLSAELRLMHEVFQETYKIVVQKHQARDDEGALLFENEQPVMVDDAAFQAEMNAALGEMVTLDVQPFQESDFGDKLTWRQSSAFGPLIA